MSFHTVFLSAAVVASLAGCAAYSPGPSATAQLEPTRGNTAAGTVTFVQSGETVKVSGSIPASSRVPSTAFTSMKKATAPAATA